MAYKTYRVQISGDTTVVRVNAYCEEEAKEKALAEVRKYLADYISPYVVDIRPASPISDEVLNDY